MEDEHDDDAGVRAGAPGAIPDDPSFDPYRFQTMQVSPDLRRELTRAKLPRLDAEYFEDTSPEGRVRSQRPRHSRRMLGMVLGLVLLLLGMLAASVLLHWS